jgi:hypothetical protein
VGKKQRSFLGLFLLLRVRCAESGTWLRAEVDYEEIRQMKWLGDDYDESSGGFSLGESIFLGGLIGTCLGVAVLLLALLFS